MIVKGLYMDINKQINLNKFIYDLKQYFDIVTYAEHIFITCIKWHKVHTILYCDNDISLLIVNNKYRLYQSWNGATFDYDTIEELENSLDSALIELEQNI